MATAAPANSARTKAGALRGAMPANVSLSMRPKTAAGLANDVEAVNQYAAPIQAATIAATRVAGARRTTSTSPNVATPSAIHCLFAKAKAATS